MYNRQICNNVYTYLILRLPTVQEGGKVQRREDKTGKC